MMNQIILLASLAVATAITRFLPFILFPAGKKTPRYIEFLGSTLPYAAIGLLVVYCLKGSFIGLQSHMQGIVSGKEGLTLGKAGIPEFLAAALVIVLHKWKGNSLLSIGLGTVFYMMLIQFVF